MWMDAELYEKDFYEWALKNAELLRQGRLSEIDVENIAEELESMGKSERRELISRLVVLFMHLLKWEHQPKLRSRSWSGTIVEQRTQIELLLKDSPSLRREIDPKIEDAYRIAVKRMEKETGISKKDLPDICPYSLDQAMDDDFWPGQNHFQKEG
jgi:hypothetical protein